MSINFYRQQTKLQFKISFRAKIFSKMSQKYPFKWSPISPELNKRYYELCPDERSSQRDMIVSQPGNVIMCKNFSVTLAESIYNFELRTDDVWINTFPKCGTTWTQEMVWQIVNGCKFEEAKKDPLWLRSPFLEFQGITKLAEYGAENLLKLMAKSSMSLANEASSPRVLKSHLPMDMLNPKLLDTCKVIYVARNPKDCCVSFFHHMRLFNQSYKFEGSFDDFSELFMKENIEYGSFWYHLKSAYKHRDSKNLKIIWYEDMKVDLRKVIREVCEFLGRQLTVDQEDALFNFLQIDNMRDTARDIPVCADNFHEQMLSFFRKGEIGDWKNFVKNNEQWDNWIEENSRDTDIHFRFK